MSRANNSVRLIGRVVKGPFARYTKEGKLRCEYQIEVEGKGNDKGHYQAPFIRSLGAQAEKDLKGIKVGNVVVIEGKLITRYEKKHYYFLRDDNNSNYMKPLDLENEEEDYDYDDSLIVETDIIRPITEVYADDVYYLGNLKEDLFLKEDE